MSNQSKPRMIGEVLADLGLGFEREGAMSRDQVFAALRALGVEEAEVAFSGGNDEGGVTEIRFARPEGQVEEVSPYGDYDEKHGRWARGDGYLEPLIDGLSAPVYSQYGGFAGDFHVEGTVTWKVSEGTVVQTGSEEIPRAESIDREL